MNRLLFCTKKKWLPSETTSLRMVRRKGLEPPTYWFVASHSIQLSYKRILYGAVFNQLIYNTTWGKFCQAFFCGF